MRSLRRHGWLAPALALPLLAAPTPARRDAAAVAPPAAPQNEILWDRFGVPHIRARDAESLAWGFGYAQMRNHANLLLRLFGQARGRAAEYWGADWEQSDRLVRTMGIPARAREWYARQSPSFRRHLDAFAAGLTAYAREHPDEIPDSLRVVLPLTATDVLAHGQRVINITFVAGEMMQRASSWEGGHRETGVTRPPRDASGGGRATPDSRRVASRDAWSEEEPSLGYGSNAWALAPARSASRAAMLLANPHLPWSDLFTWVEAQLTAPGVDVYGATLVGSPVITIGFNENVAWTHTVNTFDGADLYELTLDAAGARHAWDGAMRPLDVATETMKVRQRDGTLATRTLTIKRSVHGPIVAERGDRALALRVVGLDRPGAAEEWWEMGRARDLASFERALRRLQIPMFNVVYAGRDGHIMYLYNGLVPERPRGTFEDWLGIVRGDSSATLWTATLPYDSLPRVVDPATGWVQNANDAPWTSTVPQTLAPDRFPTYLSPRGMAFRPQRSAKLVSEGTALTLDEMVRRKHDVRLELAERIVDDVVAAARARGSDAARRAADVLARWDRTAGAEARGAVLFARFWRELARRSTGSPFARPWDPAHPLETPRGLADPALAARALETAAVEVERSHGVLDVAWGEVHRLRRDAADLPGNGASGVLGAFRVVDYGGATDSSHRQMAAGGDSFIAAVELTRPVRARVLVGYGNASQPGSPHRVDQLPFVARRALREAWLTREAVMANLESRKAY